MIGKWHHTYRSFLYGTVALGCIAIGVSCYQVSRGSLDVRWLVLTVLTAIVASFSLKLPGVSSKVSVADTLVLVSAILFGPAAGCLSAAVEALVGSLDCATRERRFEFLTFNTASIAACVYLAGHVYVLFGMGKPLGPARLVPSALVLAMSYFLLNSMTVAAMVSLERHKSVYRIWRDNFLWQSLNFAASGFAAALVALGGNVLTPSSLIAMGFFLAIVHTTCRLVTERFSESTDPENHAEICRRKSYIVDGRR
jgi:hypothetical protein